MEINPLSQLYSDLISIISSATIKYDAIAKDNETDYTRMSSDEYLKVLYHEDTFFTHYNYESEFIRTAITESEEYINNGYITVTIDDIEYKYGNTSLGIEDVFDLKYFISVCNENRDMIPYEYRDRILELQQEKILSNYMELNNYYRMLAGLPNIETEDQLVAFDNRLSQVYIDSYRQVYLYPANDTDIVNTLDVDSSGNPITKTVRELYNLDQYVELEDDEEYDYAINQDSDSIIETGLASPTDINTTRPIPIHEFLDVDIDLLRVKKIRNSDGTAISYIDKLISQYTNMKYLKYLGTKKIDVAFARRSKNFALLSELPDNISKSSKETFLTIYDRCREYFMTVIYIPQYRKTIDYYDNFIGMCIMVMAIQQMIARVVKNVVERDFFDDYYVSAIFNHYGIPSLSYIDDDSKRSIIQNLNILIQNKGTNRSIYDILNILGFDNTKLYKYYLVRSRNINSGIPVEYDADDISTYEKAFTLNFHKIDMESSDIYQALINPEAIIPYDTIVAQDKYWYWHRDIFWNTNESYGANPTWLKENDDLMYELYKNDYNFLETKYIGVGVSYSFVKMIFENVYLLRMIADNKTKLNSVRVNILKLYSKSDISLFDALMLVTALMFRYNKLPGNIYAMDSKMIGFNFNLDFNNIRTKIKKSNYLSDNLLSLIISFDIRSTSDINDTYDKILELHDVIINTMTTTMDIDLYNAYKELYVNLFYTEVDSSIFTMSSGEVASTYSEYVSDIIGVNNYNNMASTSKSNEEILNSIRYILDIISSSISDIKYYGTFDDNLSIIKDLLYNMVSFFKSYTSEIIDFNTSLVVDSKSESLVKYIDDIDETSLDIPTSTRRNLLCENKLCEYSNKDLLDPDTGGSFEISSNLKYPITYHVDAKLLTWQCPLCGHVNRNIIDISRPEDIGKQFDDEGVYLDDNVYNLSEINTVIY